MTKPPARFQSGPVLVAVYQNEDGGKVYLDIVIYRKVGNGGQLEFKRGANLKPQDLPVLVSLLGKAQEYIETRIPPDQVP